MQINLNNTAMEKEEIIKLKIKAKELDEELSIINERIFKETYHFAAKELTGKCFISKSSDEVYALKITWVDTPSYGVKTNICMETVIINYTASHPGAEYYKNVSNTLRFLAGYQEITEEEYNAIKIEAAEKILSSIRENHETAEKTPSELACGAHPETEEVTADLQRNA